MRSVIAYQKGKAWVVELPDPRNGEKLVRLRVWGNRYRALQEAVFGDKAPEPSRRNKKNTLALGQKLQEQWRVEAGVRDYKGDLTPREWYDLALNSGTAQLAKSTLRARRLCLGELVGWMEERGIELVADLTPLLGSEFVRGKMQEGRAASTCHWMLGTISGCWSRAMDMGRLPKDMKFPMSPLDLPVVEEDEEACDSRRSKAWSCEQAKSLESEAETDGYGLFIRLLAGTGMRISEVLRSRAKSTPGLKVQNIDFERGFIRLTREMTKGRKARNIPLSDELLSELREVEPFPDGRIFGYRRSAMQRRMRKWVVNAGYKGTTPALRPSHAFRHRLCIRLLANNVPINIVKEIMGHSKIETTQAYMSPQMLESPDEFRSYMSSVNGTD